MPTKIHFVASWLNVCTPNVRTTRHRLGTKTSVNRPELFDEYTRRQYVAKAPDTYNPFGTDKEPKPFAEFDVFTKLRVLWQLSQWTMWNPDRFRLAFPEGQPGKDERGREHAASQSNQVNWVRDFRKVFIVYCEH